MIVMKFGGTSVGSQERFEQVYGLIENAGKKDAPPLVVVSAMSGVTNALIEAANLAVRRNLDGALEQIEMVRQKYISAIQGLLSKDKVDELLQYLNEHLAELESVLRGINYLGELSKRSVDAVSSVGELLSSRVLAEYAESRGMKVRWLDARKIVITDDNFGKANPDWAEIDNRAAEIKALNKQGFTVITQGFIGSTHDGVTTTLGRGGSDYSASIIGVAAGASIIEIWTDVDGMMTADPRVVKNARPISEVSFQEASELAYFGAKVLHPLTIKPAVEKNISVKVLNTMRPESEGTLIQSRPSEAKALGDGSVCAIASKKNITALFISSPRMLMAHGFLAKVFAVFDKHQTPIDLIATSEVSLSLTIDSTESLEAIKEDLQELGELQIQDDTAIVTVVGRQFRERSGIAGEVFSALRDVNILVISGGASEINLSFLVMAKDADRAVCQLHDHFFGD
ncbi:MAG: lysine-sensitive aspartokinase 3 [Candidatus Obscuribacter sp.]|nr:lysine-sensitive aspartokinase 3 [Candidatus Obscuribacter sp.]